MVFHKENGFTLVELMIVIGVIGILSGMYVMNAQAGLEEARAGVCEKNRTLCEDQEQLFYHREERPSLSLQELVDLKYVNKASCPRGGVLTWEVTDPNLNYEHQALVCSIHGPRVRIRCYKTPSTSTAAIEKYALTADFEGGAATGWTEVNGKYWEVAGGTYRAGKPKGNGGEHRSFSGDESWTDYTVSADVTLERGKGYGIYFRATDPKAADAYIFQYDPGYGKGAFLFRKIVNGRERGPFARVYAPKGYDWFGSEKNVSIQVEGDKFTASVDGETVLTGSDSTYSQGGIGLRTWSNSLVQFDDVQVELSD